MWFELFAGRPLAAPRGTPPDTLAARAAVALGGQVIAADETLEACVDAVEHACRIPRDRPALVVAPDRAAARRLHGKLAGRLRDRPVEPDLWPTRLPGKDAAAGRYARVRRAVVTAAGCGAAGASNVPYGAVVHSAAGAAVTRAAVTGAAGACRVRGAPVLAVVTPGGIGGPGNAFLRDALVGPVLWDMTACPEPTASTA